MDHTISQRNFFISIPKFQIIQFTHRIFIFKRQKGQKKKKKKKKKKKRTNFRKKAILEFFLYNSAPKYMCICCGSFLELPKRPMMCWENKY